MKRRWLIATLAALTACDTPRTVVDGPAPTPTVAPAPAAIAAPSPVPTAPTRPPAPSRPVAVGPQRLALQDALLTALERNSDLRVQRYEPLIRAEDLARKAAEFDPEATASIQRRRDDDRFGAETGAEVRTRRDVTSLEAGLRQGLWTGTSWEALATSTTTRQDGEQSTAHRLGLTVSQALLRGAGSAVGLADVRQARLDLAISRYGLRGYVAAVASTVEKAYWSHALARERLVLVEESMRLTERQLSEAREIVAAGRMAGVELSASEAEVALRAQVVLDAREEVATSRLLLQSLLGASGADYQRPLDLLDRPFVPERGVDPLDAHLAVAQRLRPDLNQARLEIQRGDLELVKTRNGLLPRLDLFVTLGGTGYARGFGDAIQRDDGRGRDLTIGLTASIPLGNRAANADHRRAGHERDQVAAALTNLERLAELDVLIAHLAALSARERVAAAAATVQLQERKLEAQTEKFRIGTASTLAVAQAQRDLLDSRLSAITAVVDHLIALDELYWLDGSLLARRGIAAPGDVSPGR